jgi:8-oxo-dGTP diphosphatase
LVRSYGRKDSATVICSQGDVIPPLLSSLADQDGVDIPQPPPNKKGSVWVLCFEDGRLTDPSYFPPPA